jgi:shikimate dehydrogenase
MPLKLEAVALAEEPSDRAIGTGAANILLPRNAKLAAGNTDVGAVLQLVRGLGHGGSAMAPIVLMGSGGAARAALMALHILGLPAVRIHSRNMAEATALAVQFGLGEQPRPFTEPLAGAALINATPLGMAGAPPFAFALDGIDPRGCSTS